MKRGSTENPKNRFETLHREKFAPDDAVDPLEEGPSPRTIFLKDSAKSIIASNQSPDVGFEFSVNPYRGCEHGCTYCYARPTHEYLGMSSGLDFESKILVKEDAPMLLRKELSSSKWVPSLIAMSGVTDCYQPIERKLQLTRKCLEVLLDYRNPVIIITKNFLVTRDIDLLAELAMFQAARVMVSVTTLDDELCGNLEPRTSRPRKRLEAIENLSQAGIPTGVMVAPTIPGLTDHEIPNILKAARDAGAVSAGVVPLRLPYANKELFSDWLQMHYPDRREKVLHRVQEIRGGKLNDSNFGSRMRGEGPYAEQIRALFKLTSRRLGFKTLPESSTEFFRKILVPKDGDEKQLRFDQI